MGMKYKDPTTGKFKEINVKVADTLPVGSIVQFAGTIIPTGWELIDNTGTYKLIKKVSQSTPIKAKVVNSYSESEEETYSCDYINKMVDVIYPVGSIYMSVNSTSPATLFGGTWEQIKGRFLLGAGRVEANTTDFWGSTSAGETSFTAGEMGGEYYHTLSYNEMPKHTHDIKSNTTDGSLGWTIKDHQANAQVEDLKWQWGGRCISYAGESQRHNNMPPFLAVYMWKRIS